MHRIVQVIPFTPPKIDGVGDYARKLQTNWPVGDVEWHVAALSVSEGAESVWPEATFHQFRPEAVDLARVLTESQADIAFVHYVGYGYAPKGVPPWFPKGLGLWKQESKRSIITFFHELFAFSPPWRTPFWLAPNAIAVLRDLVRTSEELITSNHLYARQLKVYGGSSNLPVVVPIGSAIPNLGLGHGKDMKAAKIAVFGSEGTRRKALKVHRKFLMQLVKEGRLDSLLLFGSGSAIEDDDIVSLCNVKQLSNVSESEASSLFNQCDLGLIATDEARFSKSSVLAAYCQHEVIPIIDGRRSDGPYLRSSDAATVWSSPSRIAEVRARVADYALESSGPVIAKVWSDHAASLLARR